MILHESTFEYLKPTDEQLMQMADLRHVFREFALYVEGHLQPGADRDHVLRTLRTAAMWANVCITREADGTPRT